MIQKSKTVTATKTATLASDNCSSNLLFKFNKEFNAGKPSSSASLITDEFNSNVRCEATTTKKEPNVALPNFDLTSFVPSTTHVVESSILSASSSKNKSNKNSYINSPEIVDVDDDDDDVILIDSVKRSNNYQFLSNRNKDFLNNFREVNNRNFNLLAGEKLNCVHSFPCGESKSSAKCETYSPISSDIFSPSLITNTNVSHGSNDLGSGAMHCWPNFSSILENNSTPPLPGQYNRNEYDLKNKRRKMLRGKESIVKPIGPMLDSIQLSQFRNESDNDNIVSSSNVEKNDFNRMQAEHHFDHRIYSDNSKLHTVPERSLMDDSNGQHPMNNFSLPFDAYHLKQKSVKRAANSDSLCSLNNKSPLMKNDSQVDLAFSYAYGVQHYPYINGKESATGSTSNGKCESEMLDALSFLSPNVRTSTELNMQYNTRPVNEMCSNNLNAFSIAAAHCHPALYNRTISANSNNNQSPWHGFVPHHESPVDLSSATTSTALSSFDSQANRVTKKSPSHKQRKSNIKGKSITSNLIVTYFALQAFLCYNLCHICLITLCYFMKNFIVLNFGSILFEKVLNV